MFIDKNIALEHMYCFMTHAHYKNKKPAHKKTAHGCGFVYSLKLIQRVFLQGLSQLNSPHRTNKVRHIHHR